MEYRNAVNKDRAVSIDRKDRVKEAGEVFTPQWVVNEILAEEPLKNVTLDCAKTVLEPAAGDGNFVASLLRLRLTSLEMMTAPTVKEVLSTIYSIEIQEDNHEVLKKRVLEVVKEFLPNLSREEEGEVKELIEAHHLRGSYLSGRGCSLSCPPHCTSCKKLLLPVTFDAIIGNPPYNPKAMYKDFVEKGLQESSIVTFILPTSWLLSESHTAFRKKVTPHLSKIKKLSWSAFKIKMRTCVAHFTTATSQTVLFDGVTVTPTSDGHYRVCNPIMEKAYKYWSNTLNDYSVKSGAQNSSAPVKRNKNTEDLFSVLSENASSLDASRKVEEAFLHIGWKCNVEGGRGKVNHLQSLAVNFEGSSLPNNVHSFRFPAVKERDNYIKYSATKLAAFLQSQWDSDSVARTSPVPPLDEEEDYYTDSKLYQSLGLSADEVAEVEGYQLYFSHALAQTYKNLGVKVREDAIIGRERAKCADCGSSSFHRGGCPRGTDREKTLRDRA